MYYWPRVGPHGLGLLKTNVRSVWYHIAKAWHEALGLIWICAVRGPKRKCAATWPTPLDLACPRFIMDLDGTDFQCFRQASKIWDGSSAYESIHGFHQMQETSFFAQLAGSSSSIGLHRVRFYLTDSTHCYKWYFLFKWLCDGGTYYTIC